LIAVPAIAIAGWLLLGRAGLTLYVSNQSSAMDPVHIHVTVDGDPLADGDFAAEDFHAWHAFEVSLRPGWHRIVAVSENGDAELDSDFLIFWPRHWAVLDYWYRPREDVYPRTPRHFTFYISIQPPRFQ
jgi:hypothetical protein